MAQGPETIPAVFKDRAAAEAAIQDLRKLGLRDEDIGVLVLDPGHYQLMRTEEAQAYRGAAHGIEAGVPLGALAGIGLAAIAVPELGIAGIGGLLAATGVVWGAMLGGYAGLIAKLKWDDDEDAQCDVPLGTKDILVLARAGKKGPEAYRALASHGAICFLDQQALDQARRQLEASAE